MEVDLHESLTEMYPGLGYTMSNNDYDTLIWLDTNVPKPSKQTLLLRGQEIINAKPLKKLRQERNQRLAETDWIFSTDYHIPSELRKKWTEYRQKLRDLPSVTTDPEHPVWPEKPTVNPSGGSTVNVDLDHIANLTSQISLLQNVIFTLTKRIEALEQA